MITFKFTISIPAHIVKNGDLFTAISPIKGIKFSFADTKKHAFQNTFKEICNYLSNLDSSTLKYILERSCKILDHDGKEIDRFLLEEKDGDIRNDL